MAVKSIVENEFYEITSKDYKLKYYFELVPRYFCLFIFKNCNRRCDN